MNHGHDTKCNYSELLEFMVKYVKNKKGLENNKLIEEDNNGATITLGEFMWRNERYVTQLKAMMDRANQLRKSVKPLLVIKFWCLMTLVEDSTSMIATKFQQMCFQVADRHALFLNEDNYSAQLIDLSSRELKKIKEEYPNEVGNMATMSELNSTMEMIMSFHRGLDSLVFQITLVNVYYYHRGLDRLEELLETMVDSVEDELSQYEQELDMAAEKIKQAKRRGLRLKAETEEKKEGDDDETTKEKIRIQVKIMESKAREWMDLVKSRNHLE